MFSAKVRGKFTFGYLPGLTNHAGFASVLYVEVHCRVSIPLAFGSAYWEVRQNVIAYAEVHIRSKVGK